MSELILLKRDRMRRRFVQKRCPKCGGNVYLDRDYYGWYEKCLQCAYTRDLESILEGREEVSQVIPGQAGESARVK